MIEKLLEEATKPFEAFLTKQRCIIFLILSMALSPNVYELSSLIFTNPSISTALANFGDVFSSIKLHTFTLTLIWCFYLSPKAIYYISAYANKTELIKQRKAIESLRELERAHDDFFIDSYPYIKENWRIEKETAESKIKGRLDFSEAIFCLSFLVLFLDLTATQPFYFSLATIILCVLYIQDAATKNVSSYLSSIAPYKIATTRIKAMN
ncbi:hypothetical protein [Stutzerimonas kunmingensis]|uniref:hypothetical protein n=1 Tax=Stutzerimonas kunmingensis TaxID=1211807 RepID=UPI0021071A59|nr:hypothetical protein [Stutzerimonas kunmingensis]MCQ2036560.1 hypothetical protein [Stutzerimonas kunmingensis]